MNGIQVAASHPGIYTKNVSQLCRFHSKSCTSQMGFKFNALGIPSLTLGAKPSSGLQILPVLKSRRPLHVCLAGQGMMENNGDSQRKSLEEAMEQFKGQSIEDILQQQMRKGGSGAKPPGGRGGGGHGGSHGGSEDGGPAGMSDETLQVVLATVCFIFLYIFVINGLELAKLARDFIRFLSGRGQSVRLKRTAYKWVRFYKYLTEKKEVVKNGLGKTPTCWFNPDFLRGVLRQHMKSNSDE